MRIQHNIAAMNAYRNFVGNNNSLSKNLEKLSSGYRINRAGDDAAGLAISEKMRAQITGLDTAQKNVKDGISLVKTAEGALQEVQDMMNRMVSLATQSANGTYDDKVDRQALQDEMDALLEEIDRISDTANFNGIKLLDGTLGTEVPNEAQLAVSQITASNVDGVTPSAATSAQYEFTMGGVNAVPTTLTAATTDGQSATPGAKATFTFKLDADKITINGTDIVATDDYDTLSAVVLDNTNNITMGDVFDFSGFTGSNQLGANEITLTAKNIGALSGDIQTMLTAASADDTAADGVTSEVSFVNGRDDGTSAPGVKNKYEFTLDTTKLNGGDSMTLNGTTFTFANEVDAANTDGTIGFQTGGSTNLAATLKAELENAFTGYTATVVDNSNGQFDVKLEANTPGAAHNLGNIQKNFADNDAIISETVVDGQDAVTVQQATFAKAEYDLDMSKFAEVGAKLEIGGKTVEVVADDAADKDTMSGTTYKLSVTNATASGLQGALVQLGFDFDKVGVAGNKLTITDTQEGRSGAALTSDIGTVEFTNAGVNGVADHDDNALDIVANVTSYNDLANMEINGQKIGDLFTIKINDSEVTPDSTKIANGDKITLVAKNAGTVDSAVDTALTGYDTDGVAGADVTATAGKTAGADNAGTQAKIEYSLTGDFRAGDKIKIGSKEVTIVADGETDAAAGKFSVADATDANLSAYFTGNGATVAFNSGKVTITKDDKDGTTAADMATNYAMSVDSDRSVVTDNDGLTLQIGDSVKETIDVKIDDMGTDGLAIDGLKGVGIMSRTAANNAIDTLKTAINTVSSQRGRLGAIQNRLEHTTNNLSVMKENITDAESAIRDTDMADEMTAYTKNNILVQAAQAMLAQANQQPQGVLQLLQ